VENQVLRIQSITAGLGFVGPANPIMQNGMFAMTSSYNYNALKKVCKEAMNTRQNPTQANNYLKTIQELLKNLNTARLKRNTPI